MKIPVFDFIRLLLAGHRTTETDSVYTPGARCVLTTFTLKDSMNVIFGINAVAESLKSRGRAFEWVGVASERKDIRLQNLIKDCRKLSVPVRFLPRVELDHM